MTAMTVKISMRVNVFFCFILFLLYIVYMFIFQVAVKAELPGFEIGEVISFAKLLGILCFPLIFH